MGKLYIVGTENQTLLSEYQHYLLNKTRFTIRFTREF